ncbi:MAG: TetR/AcrR family transcriptional regulator [Chloroflexi bacterium]|nr:TetR/AcrR family transcriptional regulator [Chloroflexota bacterium]
MVDSDALNRFERHKQRTRQTLVQAALELISSRGYDAVSVQDITDRADVGRGTFYLHFKNKEDLLWGILQEYFDRLADETDARYAAEPSPRREFLAWVDFFEKAKQNSYIYRLLRNINSPFLRERVAHYFLLRYEKGMREQRYSANLNLPVDFLAAFAGGASLSVLEWYMERTEQYTGREIAAMMYMVVFRQAPPE